MVDCGCECLFRRLVIVRIPLGSTLEVHPSYYYGKQELDQNQSNILFLQTAQRLQLGLKVGDPFRKSCLTCRQRHRARHCRPNLTVLVCPVDLAILRGAAGSSYSQCCFSRVQNEQLGRSPGQRAFFRLHRISHSPETAWSTYLQFLQACLGLFRTVGVGSMFAVFSYGKQYSVSSIRL